jgi:hypothetical protein
MLNNCTSLNIFSSKTHPQGPIWLQHILHHVGGEKKLYYMVKATILTLV